MDICINNIWRPSWILSINNPSTWIWTDTLIVLVIWGPMKNFYTRGIISFTNSTGGQICSLTNRLFLLLMYLLHTWHLADFINGPSYTTYNMKQAMDRYQFHRFVHVDAGDVQLLPDLHVFIFSLHLSSHKCIAAI